MKISVPVSVGELFDKISILEIKQIKIKDKKSRQIIKYELNSLKSIVKKNKLMNKRIKKSYESLKNINTKLWRIEDQKRECERQGKFDKKFIKLARNVYIFNDRRAKIKSEIDIISGSKIKEIKSHKDY